MAGNSVSMMPMEWGSPVNLKVWVGTATTTSGVATFNPTSDGTGSGTALFAAISYVIATARSNTAVATVAPSASIKAIGGDLKSVTVNVTNGTILAVLGATALFAADGTVVDVMIFGS